MPYAESYYIKSTFTHIIYTYTQTHTDAHDVYMKNIQTSESAKSCWRISLLFVGDKFAGLKSCKPKTRSSSQSYRCHNIHCSVSLVSVELFPLYRSVTTSESTTNNGYLKKSTTDLILLLNQEKIYWCVNQKTGFICRGHANMRAKMAQR